MLRLLLSLLISSTFFISALPPAFAREGEPMEPAMTKEGSPEENVEVERSAKERFLLAVELASKGKLDEANDEISPTLLMEPQNPVIRDIKKILTDVEEQLITKDIAVYLFKGMIFGKKRLYIKEGAYYDKALKLAPLYAPLFLYRGRSLQMAGNPAEAIEDYTRAIELDPLFAYAFYTRGLAHKKAELFELALDDYTRAIELEEGFAMAYNNRGFLYIVHFEDKESGCNDWQSACELGLCTNLEMAKENGDCGQPPPPPPPDAL